jgi:hypothetical protein
MIRKLWLALPLVLVLVTSGCSSLCVVPIPGICNGDVTEFPHDVIVIKSLEALPNKVSPGQQIKLQSYIENVGNKEVGRSDVESNGEIEVVLYDYCGIFSRVDPDCPDGKGSEIDQADIGKGCEISLLPHQTKSVSWTLTADQNIKLLTECKLKIYAKYEYETDSVTSITFIDYDEYQKMLDEGTFQPITSYITEGYGPIKPYLTVEDPQPIPVDFGGGGTSTIGFQIKNRGNGFISGENLVKKDWITMDATSLAGGYNIVSGVGDTTTEPDGETIYDGLLSTGGKGCLPNQIEDDGLALIGKESPKIICAIPLPDKVNLPKQSTIHVSTTINYEYEFRKDIKVTIEPKS